METQVCNNCHKEKPVDKFFYRNKVKKIRHEQCKKCLGQKRRSKEHYIKYKTEYILRAKKRRIEVTKENRINLIEYFKKHPCINCGESNPVVLDFDHRVGEKKSIEVSKILRDRNWSTIIIEINKCDVLCANCHRIKTSKQLGWFYEYLIEK